MVAVVAAKAAKQTSNIGGNGVQPHRSNVDDAAYSVAFEENVVVPDVSKAWLLRCFNPAGGSKLVLQVFQLRIYQFYHFFRAIGEGWHGAAVFPNGGPQVR
jgi:hypothetical protein